MLSHFHLYGELRFPGAMGRRNGPSGLREEEEDDDDDGDDNDVGTLHCCCISYSKEVTMLSAHADKT